MGSWGPDPCWRWPAALALIVSGWVTALEPSVSKSALMSTKEVLMYWEPPGARLGLWFSNVLENYHPGAFLSPLCLGPDSFKCRANRSWTRMCTIDAVSSFPFCPWNTSLRPAQAITVPSCSSIADWTKRVENKPIIAFHPSRRDPLIAEGRRHWLLS